LHPFLKDYVNNWPVREYLKRHFSNQRNYRTRKQYEATNDKGKGKAIDKDVVDDSLDSGGDGDADTGEDGEE
jgi:hypothetical protein